MPELIETLDDQESLDLEDEVAKENLKLAQVKLVDLTTERAEMRAELHGKEVELERILRATEDKKVEGLQLNAQVSELKSRLSDRVEDLEFR